MIKFNHSHDDKDCYSADMRYSNVGMYRMRGTSAKPFIVAYRQYTAHWYAFNPETGQEIATFTNEFYEGYIKSLKISDMSPDPNCKLN